MTIFQLSTIQIIYICAVVGGFAIVYGRKFYKEYKKKQEAKQHRKDWKSRY